MFNNNGEATAFVEKAINKSNEYNFKVVEVSGNLNDDFLSVSWVVTINEPSVTSVVKDDAGKDIVIVTPGKELFCTNGISKISKVDDLGVQKAVIEAEAIESAKAYNPNPKIIYANHPLIYSAVIAIEEVKGEIIK